jgi:plastocyanin
VIVRATHLALRSAVLAAALAGCAGAAPRPVRHEIQITAFGYRPASEPVHPGDTLVFINHDAVPHTATAADKRWDSGNIPAGETRTVVVPAEGIEGYKCLYHPNMGATLVKAE